MAVTWKKIAFVDDITGGGSPGGTDHQLQYNNGGAFGGMLLEYTSDLMGTGAPGIITPDSATAPLSFGLKAGAGTANDASGGMGFLFGGDADGAGYGGSFVMMAGIGGVSGVGGDFYSYGGNGGSVNGDAGNLAFSGGTANGANNGGKCWFFGGNAADTQILAPVRISGSGLNDITSGGTYTGASGASFTIAIDSVGGTDTFQWQKGSGSATTLVAMTGAPQALSDGVTITWAATTGHTLGDAWSIQCDVGTGGNMVFQSGCAGTRYAPAIINPLGGNVGINTLSDLITAKLHIAASPGDAASAPLKLNPGTLMTVPELGAIEFTDDGVNGHLYITLNVASVLTRILIV
jgi:hypothetical protein